MHKRPLIQKRSGHAVRVTEFNSLLKEDLKHVVGAVEASSFTFHGIRHGRIADAKEDPALNPQSVERGAGHSSKGSHSVSYKGCFETPWMLMGAGYSGKDPEELAAHTKVLYHLIEMRSELVNKILQDLFAEHRPEWLELEKAVEEMPDDPQEETTLTKKCKQRMKNFIHCVRHMILAWIVSTAARPRDQHSFIDVESLPKRFLMHKAFVSHISSLIGTTEYAEICELVCQEEEVELNSGMRAQRSGTESRLTACLQTLSGQIHTITMADRERMTVDQAEKQIEQYQSLKKHFVPIGLISSWRCVLFAFCFCSFMCILLLFIRVFFGMVEKGVHFGYAVFIPSILSGLRVACTQRPSSSDISLAMSIWASVRSTLWMRTLSVRMCMINLRNTTIPQNVVREP